MGNKIDEIIEKNTITADDAKDQGFSDADISILKSIKGRDEPNATLIKMDDYFNVEGVMAPFVEVYFLGKTADDKTGWVNLQPNEGHGGKFQNNFFDSMSIEDNGFLTLTLTLIDRTNYRVQRLLYNANYLLTKDQEETNRSQAVNDKIENSDLTLEVFKENPKFKTNLRIRYGYADSNTEWSSNDNRKERFDKIRYESRGGGPHNPTATARYVSASEYTSDDKKSGESLNPAKVLTQDYTQTRIMSPYEEFYIIGYNSQITTTGIKYTIKAIQPVSLFLNNYKLVQSYNKLVGTPREIMAFFMKTFNESSGITVKWFATDEKLKRIQNFKEKTLIKGKIKEEEIKDDDEDNREKSLQEEREKLNKKIKSLKALKKIYKLLSKIYSNTGFDNSEKDDFIKIAGKWEFCFNYDINLARFTEETEDSNKASGAIDYLNKTITYNPTEFILTEKTPLRIYPGFTSEDPEYFADIRSNGDFVRKCTKAVEDTKANSEFHVGSDIDSREFTVKRVISCWLSIIVALFDKEQDIEKNDKSTSGFEITVRNIIEELKKKDDSISYKQLFDQGKKIEKKIIEIEKELNEKSDIKAEVDKISGSEGKQIELVLGGLYEDSKPRYKSLSSLFSSYTSQAPSAYIEESKSDKKVITKDEEGNDRELTIEERTVPRKMTWCCLPTKDNENAKVLFYYSRPVKPKVIRSYEWGTGNPNQHCIKDLNITSETEFAIMLSNSTYVANDRSDYKASLNDKSYSASDAKDGLYFNIINKTDDILKYANENMYKGSMTILGDPSYRFYGPLQPYMFPIKIDVKLQTEQTTWSNKEESYQESALSGYYVITKITHQINSSGYYTNLEITRYPGIENDV